MRLWFAAALLLFSSAVFAIPDNPAAAIVDFFSTIADFVAHTNSEVYGWVKERWASYMYGDYEKLLEYDLGGINTEPPELFFQYATDRSDPEQYFAAASLDSLRAAKSSARLAADQRSKCISLYKERESCSRDCPTAYAVKTCTEVFFTQLNSATEKLNASFGLAMRQTEADYTRYIYYGIDAGPETKLFGCYLSVVGVYNDFAAFKSGGAEYAEKAKQDGDLGGSIIYAFSSLERSPRFYNVFFNTLGGGKDSVISRLLAQHGECSKIEKAVFEEFSGKAAAFIKRLGAAQAGFEELKKQGVCELGQQDIDAILGSEEAELQGLSVQISPEGRATGANPAQACELIAGALSNLTGLKNRLALEESKNRFLVRTSQDIDGSERVFLLVDDNLARAKKQSEGIGEKARLQAQALLAEAAGYKSNIPGDDATSKAILLAEFGQMYGNAESAMGAAAKETTEGGRAKKYSLAIRELARLREAFGPDKGTETYGSLLLRASGMVSLAKDDGIETSRESALIGNAKAHAKQGRELAASALLRGAITGILEKAEARYAQLPGQRARIKSELSFLSDAGAAADASKFVQYEQFFSGGGLDTGKALGNLKNIKDDYALLDEKLSTSILSNQSALLSALLSKNQPELLGDVVAGEPSQVLLSFDFTNGLPFSIDPRAVYVPFKYRPAGRISGEDVVFASSVGVAQEGDDLVLFPDELRPGGGFSLKLLYGSVVVPAAKVSVEEAHTQRTATWKFSAKLDAPAGLKKVFVPVPANGHLLGQFPQDFSRRGEQQYLVFWRPGSRNEREFSTPAGITVERTVVGTAPAQGSGVRLSEKVRVKNGLDVRLNGVRIDIPAYAGVEGLRSTAPAVAEGQNLALTIDLAPREAKEVLLNYTVDDPQFYSEVLLSETDAKLSVIESRPDSSLFSSELAQLRARRDVANGLYADGSYGASVSELLSVSAESAALENRANQDSAQKEAFLKLNRSVSERMDELSELNLLYPLLNAAGAKKDTKQLEGALALANREFLRGNAANASGLLASFSLPQADERATARAIEAKKSELAGRIDNLTGVRAALSKLGIKDAVFNGHIDSSASGYTAFSLAASAKNYSGARAALQDTQSSLSLAEEQQELLVSEADAVVVAFLVNRSNAIESLEQEMSSADYKNALSLHLPPAVGAWARENGLGDESDGFVKTAAALQKELADEKRTIHLALNSTPQSRVRLFGSAAMPDTTGRAEAFLGASASVLGSKRQDSGAALLDANARLRDGLLDGGAGVLLASAERAHSAGRFQDSLAYTGYASAVFSKEPRGKYYYAAALLVVALIAYAYLNRTGRLGKFRRRDSSELDDAERRIFLRKNQ